MKFNFTDVDIAEANKAPVYELFPEGEFKFTVAKITEDTNPNNADQTVLCFHCKAPANGKVQTVFHKIYFGISQAGKNLDQQARAQVIRFAQVCGIEGFTDTDELKGANFVAIVKHKEYNGKLYANLIIPRKKKTDARGQKTEIVEEKKVIKFDTIAD